MNRRRIIGFAALALAVLLLPAMASEQVKLYLPLISRMPEPTPTLIPGHYYLSGRVFFDFNGSGLQEEGEPGVPGVPAYVDSLGSALHTVTAVDGLYSIPNVPPGVHQVYVQSPTQDPATAFRYINLFKGWVDIAAYEMSGVQVPAQHLPDTEIQSIDQPLSVLVSGAHRLDVALLQGLLTSPFAGYQMPNTYIWSYFDNDNESITCRGYPVQPNGRAVSYDGQYTRDGGGDPIHPSIGVGDGHEAYDFSVPLGYFILNAGPTGKVWGLPVDNGEMRVHTLFFVADLCYQNCYGHLSAPVVTLEQRVHRGQILGVSGHSGTSPYHQLHFDLSKSVQIGSDMCNQYIDPFRSTIPSASLPPDFCGSRVSYWTVDNQMIPSIDH